MQHLRLISYLQKIDCHIKQNHKILWEKYAELGSKTIKIICYSQEFIPLIEKQLSYILKDRADKVDATIIVWHEKETKNFLNKIVDTHIKSRLRLEQLMFKNEETFYETADENLLLRINSFQGQVNNFEMLDIASSKHDSIIKICTVGGIINARDVANNIYFYGVRDLEPEEFIKQGHIFVKIFNQIIKTKNSALIHGAVVGCDNKGILFCARGQRGKSTLAVLAMMKGFEYVSDDYLALEKEGDELFAYPLYSIITLSPKMYNQLYDDLRGKFVSNNARRDKYVIDVKAYHETFRKKYPIKICMFPQIVDDENPSIAPCEKGRAITQLVHSTIWQMDDRHDIKTIQKLISFVKDFDFYQINLCSDIVKNVECLRQFHKNNL